MNLFYGKRKKEEDCACYVLITCSKPDEKGEMKVAMDFEGDEDLAAYLVESAGQVFREKFANRGVD